MSPPSGPWRLITEDVQPGPMQMALDEVAAETAANGGEWTLRVYTWDPSTLSLGYHQDPATIDWEYCAQHDIDVVRRPTGGGAIYHDRSGDISYSIVAPADELPGDLMETYTLLCKPLFEALDRLGVDARFAAEPAPPIHEPACYLRGINPAHDVVAGEGRKLSGNAQYRRKTSVIQHGSITYERAVGKHLATFTADLDPDTFRNRVTSVREQVGVDRAELVETLETAFKEWAEADLEDWSRTELERAQEIATRKYESGAWTRRHEDPMD
ncbi:MAG: biotin/lipoate A/B protein ligase family protein [Salinirussus sp.]